MDRIAIYLSGFGGEQLAWVVGLSLLTFVLTLPLVVALVVAIPAPYFLDSHVRDFWIDRHPVIRWSGLILKNALGIAIVLFGLLLTVPGVPGQGLLTILIGLILLDFPGKRRLERKLVGRPRVLRRINQLRQRFGKPPLLLSEPTTADTGSEE